MMKLEMLLFLFISLQIAKTLSSVIHSWSMTLHKVSSTETCQTHHCSCGRLCCCSGGRSILSEVVRSSSRIPV